MLFERVKAEGLAHFSYVVGDTEAGVCAVIDPRRDVDVYLDIASQNQVRIEYILETHVHADFVSGSRELSARTGAPIYVGAAGDYGFDHHPLQEGDMFETGEFTLEVLHTPGHTFEHVSYLILGGQGASEPWGVFTGDTLFAGEVGRPDLLGDDTEEELARRLYASLHDKLFALEDGVVVYPAHGEGSPCGANIGARPTSTIGYERHNNALLEIDHKDAFVEHVLASLSPAPSYYPRMKTINAEGPEVLGALSAVPALDPEQFREQMQAPNTTVVDVREIVAFAAAHAADSLNIALRNAFPVWAGRILNPEHRVLLVLPDATALDVTRRHLLRIGCGRVAGYLRQGMRGWIEAGLPFEQTRQWSVHELHEQIEDGDGLQVVDVRTDDEWKRGHVPTAQHIFVPELPAHLERLDAAKPIAVYCGSGYRSSIATSILKRNGFSHVVNIPGSMTAWKDAGYPLEKPESE